MLLPYHAGQHNYILNSAEICVCNVFVVLCVELRVACVLCVCWVLKVRVSCVSYHVARVSCCVMLCHAVCGVWAVQCVCHLCHAMCVSVLWCVVGCCIRVFWVRVGACGEHQHQLSHSTVQL